MLIFLLSFWEILSCAPFYFNYANFLLPKKYTLFHAWGFGGYEAAKFINSQPDAESAIVWADYYGVCPFIKGKCTTSHHLDINKYSIDYYVLTRRGEIRLNEKNVPWQGSKSNPQLKLLWKLYIGNRPENYVKVFKSNL